MKKTSDSLLEIGHSIDYNTHTTPLEMSAKY